MAEPRVFDQYLSRLDSLDGLQVGVAGVTDAYIPTGTDTTIDAIAGEVTGGSYTRASFTAEYSTDDNVARISEASQWPSLDLVGIDEPLTGIVTFLDDGSAGDGDLISYIPFGEQPEIDGWLFQPINGFAMATSGATLSTRITTLETATNWGTSADGQIWTSTGPDSPPTWEPAPGGIATIVPGTNVTIDDTDPANPIISATGDPIDPARLFTRASAVVDPSLDLAGGAFTDIVLATGGTFDRSLGVNKKVISPSGDDAGVWTITASGPCIPDDPQPRVGQLVVDLSSGQHYQGSAGSTAPETQATSYNVFPRPPEWVDFTPVLLCGDPLAPVDIGVGGEAWGRKLVNGNTVSTDWRVTFGTSPDFNGGGLIIMALPEPVSSEGGPLRTVGHIDVVEGTPSSSVRIHHMHSKGGTGLGVALGEPGPIDLHYAVADYDTGTATAALESTSPVDFTTDAGFICGSGTYETEA